MRNQSVIGCFSVGSAAEVRVKEGTDNQLAQVFFPLLDSPIFLANAGGAPLRSKEDSLGARCTNRPYCRYRPNAFPWGKVPA